jgi:endo-1,4-beta-D-glucanase Y
MRGLRQGLAVVLVVACGLQGGCRAEAPWPLWESYAQKFLDGQGRVIDHSGQDKTTTEGEAYGMFFALVAGDRARFDKLVQWTEDNLAGGDLTARLPAWSWGKAEDGSWRVLDGHPASDADLWMAYTLCEAGRLWKVPRYEKLGELMAARVAQTEVVTVPGLGTTLLPGAVGFHPDAQTWVVNPSYLPPPLLVYFAKRDPISPWREVLRSLPAMLKNDGGFAMDWVAVGPGGVRPAVNPATLGNGASKETPVGSYDAIRVYLWLGMSDQKMSEVKESMAAMRGMSAFMRGTAIPPVQVDGAGKVLKADGPAGFSAAVIPFLQVQGMKAEARIQGDRLIAMQDEKTGLFGKEMAYYDQNLAMFSLGWSEERFRFEGDGRLRLKWK